MTTFVSLLEPGEAHHWGFGHYDVMCRDAGIEFISWPIRSGSVPDDDIADHVLRLLHRRLAGGGHVVLHCRYALGRGPAVAAALLVGTGVPSDAAWRSLRAARGETVPQRREQAEWVERRARRDPLAGGEVARADVTD